MALGLEGHDHARVVAGFVLHRGPERALHDLDVRHLARAGRALDVHVEHREEDAQRDRVRGTLASDAHHDAVAGRVDLGGVRRQGALGIAEEEDREHREVEGQHRQQGPGDEGAARAHQP